MTGQKNYKYINRNDSNAHIKCAITEEYTMLKLGRVLDIRLEVHASWLIVFGLLTYGIGRDYIAEFHPATNIFASLGYGAIAATLLFACLLIHEFAHSLVARKCGIETESITLFIFGGFARFTRDPEKWTHELGIALAGPIASCVCAAIFAAIWLISPQGSIYATVAFYLTVSNLILATVNMLPGMPLDGGRAARAVLWGILDSRFSATRIATIAGNVLGLTAGAAGLIALIGYGNFGGAWWCLIGWFVSNAASQTWEDEQSREAELLDEAEAA